MMTQDPQEMDVDVPPTPPVPQTTPGRSSLPDSRFRTPLPSGPRLDKPLMPPPAAAPPMLTPIPNIDAVKSDLQRSASRILSTPQRSRYARGDALLLNWEDDEAADVATATEELGDVLDRYYHFTYRILKIPRPSAEVGSGGGDSSRWLSRVVHDFMDHGDTRDVLKVVFYNGDSRVDENRETVLARWGNRSRHAPPSIAVADRLKLPR